MCILFSVCAVVYAARAVMPLCIVAVSQEYHWSKTEMVVDSLVHEMMQMFTCIDIAVRCVLYVL